MLQAPDPVTVPCVTTFTFNRWLPLATSKWKGESLLVREVWISTLEWQLAAGDEHPNVPFCSRLPATTPSQIMQYKLAIPVPGTHVDGPV